MQDVRKRLISVEDEVASQFIEREDVCRLITLALLTKHHVMLVGKAGVAKSAVVEEYFSRILGAKFYHTQLDSATTNEAIFGPIDMRKYREQGVYMHNTANSLADCNLAYLDEFLDANPGVLRSMLGVLNERWFSKGASNHHVPLWTAVATTNFEKSSDRQEAVLDRFLLRSRVSRLSSEGRLKMTKLLTGDCAKVESDTRVEFSDIVAANSVVSKIPISGEFLEAYEAVISGFCSEVKSSDFWPTDRRVAQCLNVARATTFLDGGDIVKATERPLTEACMALITRNADKQVIPMTVTLSKVLVEFEMVSSFLSELEAAEKFISAFDSALEVTQERLGNKEVSPRQYYAILSLTREAQLLMLCYSEASNLFVIPPEANQNRSFKGLLERATAVSCSAQILMRRGKELLGYV